MTNATTPAYIIGKKISSCVVYDIAGMVQYRGLLMKSETSLRIELYKILIPVMYDTQLYTDN